MKQCDPDALSAEAEQLFEEVVRDYGDILRITPYIREMQAMLKQPEPKRGGIVMTEEQLRVIRKWIESPPSLAKVAEGYLDEMQNLVVGKPAPEIDGVDFDGKPLKLSDYRGKVVALVFWGTWCGPCMAAVPHERELVEKYKRRPFAMLGVDCSDPKAKAAEVMKAEGITWPNWHDGDDLDGPIASLYHISGYPTVFVIDANGTIRATNAQGDHLDKLIEQLVVEAEGETGKAGESR
jgi:thiol-disulfide isomerase/thioredoxin